MRSLVLDLETIANVKMISFLPPVSIDSRLKDPVKIEAQKAEKEVQQIEKMGLDKTTALICCITTLDIEKDEIKSVELNPETLDEKELLEEFWEIVHPFDRYVTFNGIPFDVPMLTFRSMVNQVQPSVKISIQKYRITNHMDLRALLNDWDMRASGTLDFYSRIILGESKADDMDGSFVQSMWDVGCYDEILGYNQAECRSLKRIYEKMVGYYF